MGLQSNNISVPYIVRSGTEPSRKTDGMIWINPTGGNSGNNTERYYYNKSASAWELTNSVGPDTPLYPASGAFWRDTSNGNAKQYDGSAWQNVGVTDHSNLTGVTAGDHILGSNPVFLRDKGTASRSADSNQYGNTSTSYGIKFSVNEDCNTIEATASGNTLYIDKFTVTDTSSNIIAEKTGNWSAGDTITMSVDLTAGTNYYLSAYNGAGMDIGYTSESYPVSSGSGLSLSAGVVGPHPNDGTAVSEDGNAYSYSDIRAYKETDNGKVDRFV